MPEIVLDGFAALCCCVPRGETPHPSLISLIKTTLNKSWWCLCKVPNLRLEGNSGVFRCYYNNWHLDWGGWDLEACFVTRLEAGFQGSWEQFMVLCTNQTEFLWVFFPWVLVLLASEIVTGHIQASIAEVKKPSVQFLTVEYSVVPHYREYSLL